MIADAVTEKEPVLCFFVSLQSRAAEPFAGQGPGYYDAFAVFVVDAVVPEPRVLQIIASELKLRLGVARFGLLQQLFHVVGPEGFLRETLMDEPALFVVGDVEQRDVLQCLDGRDPFGRIFVRICPDDVTFRSLREGDKTFRVVIVKGAGKGLDLQFDQDAGGDEQDQDHGKRKDEQRDFEVFLHELRLFL